jgi:hypothetical protein
VLTHSGVIAPEEPNWSMDTFYLEIYRMMATLQLSSVTSGSTNTFNLSISSFSLLRLSVSAAS